MEITNNVSSILAHQTVLDNSANNVANVNTERFVPAESTIGGAGNGAVRTNLETATDNGSTTSQTDLTNEVTDQIVAERGVEANAEAIRTQDQMYGSLLDITV